VERYVCRHCRATFAASEEFDRHMRDRHPEELADPEQLAAETGPPAPTGDPATGRGEIGRVDR
jgi:hypothetical protein